MGKVGVMQSPRGSGLPSKRIEWVDGARAVPICLVVVIHTSAPLVGRLSAETAAKWWAGAIFDSLAQIAVPIFVILSGVLLLGRRERTAELLSSFAGRRFARVMIPFLVYCGIFFAWRLYHGESLTLARALQDLYTGRVRTHLWFIYMLIGLYAFTPILRTWIAHAAHSHKLYYVITCLVGVGLLFAIEKQFFVSAGVAFVGFALYSGYFVFGGILGTWSKRGCGIPAALLVIMFVGSGALTVLGTYVATAASGAEKVDLRYFAAQLPHVVLCSLSGFLLIRHILLHPRHQGASGLVRRATTELSACSYGIYLVHPILLHVLRDGELGFHLTGASINPFPGIPLTAVVTIVACGAAVALVRRIPVLRRLLT